MGTAANPKPIQLTRLARPNVCNPRTVQLLKKNIRRDAIVALFNKLKKDYMCILQNASVSFD